MKSKKNKINLGTKTRKFYDSFVSFLFNRFNTPKKTIQKGGAKTAIEIKMEFITDIRNKGPGSKDRIEIVAKELLNKKYTTLKTNDYSFVCPALKVAGRDTPFSRYVYKNEDTISDSDVASLALFYKNSQPITDDELVSLVPDVVAVAPVVPDPAAAATAAAAAAANQIYVNFRNEIKAVLGSKQCDEITIGAAGKKILENKNNTKYELLRKYYEFDTSKFFTGDFLTWFCESDVNAPSGGFPIMFIPNGKANVPQMTPEILVNLMTNNETNFKTVPTVATTTSVGARAKPMQETSIWSTTGRALGVGAAVGAAGFGVNEGRKAWAKGTATAEQPAAPGATTVEPTVEPTEGEAAPGITTEEEAATAAAALEPQTEEPTLDNSDEIHKNPQPFPNESFLGSPSSLKSVPQSNASSLKPFFLDNSRYYQQPVLPGNGSYSQLFLPGNGSSSQPLGLPQPISSSNGALGFGASGDFAGVIGGVGLIAYFLLKKGKGNKKKSTVPNISSTVPNISSTVPSTVPAATVPVPATAVSAIAVPASGVPASPPAEADAVDLEAENKRQLESEEQKRQKRQKRADKIQKDVDKFIKADYRCETIAHQADNYLNSLEKKYEKHPTSYSTLKNSIIAYIKDKCGDDTDVSVLQSFSSEQRPLELGEASESVPFEQSSSTASPPSRLSPPGRLTPIPSQLSRINSNDSESEISSGFSWKRATNQQTTQRPGETDKNKG